MYVFRFLDKVQLQFAGVSIESREATYVVIYNHLVVCLPFRMVIFSLLLLLKMILFPPSKRYAPFLLDANWSCDPHT